MSERFSWNYLIALISFGGLSISPTILYAEFRHKDVQHHKKNNNLTYPIYSSLGSGKHSFNYPKNVDPEIFFNPDLARDKFTEIEGFNKGLSQRSGLELSIIADRQYDLNNQVFVAEGNVYASLKGAILKADRIEFNRDSKNIIASGNVTFMKGSQYFNASLFDYNITKEEGLIKNIYGVIDLNYIVDDLRFLLADSFSKDSDRLIKEEPISKIKLEGGFRLRGGNLNSSVNSVTNIDNTEQPINQWRVQSPLVKIGQDGWHSKQVDFTNDPLNPAQIRIQAKGVSAIENDDGIMIISCEKSSLILEEKTSIPLGERKFGKSESVKWDIGIDFKDRDGLYLERSFNPIEITEGLDLFLNPQLMIHRGLAGKTNSYIEPGSSPISDTKKSNITFSDLIGLKAGIKGKKLGFDLDFTAEISSFNSNRFSDASRYWGNLSRSINYEPLGDIKASFFAAYRYKAWNGSLGETDIYSAYGTFLEKEKKWNSSEYQHEANFSLGLANYQAEAFKNKSLISLWKTSAYGSLISKYSVWKGASPVVPPARLYRYSPIPIIPGFYFKTKLSSSYFLYENSFSQALFNISIGPEMVIGSLSRSFLDYTKISIMPGFTIKDGSSPFKFDNNIDLKTIEFEFDQQLYGPIILSSGVEFNIDSSSKNYGNSLSSKIAILYQRRAYDIGLFYEPHQKAGGIMINLNGFNFNGVGSPFHKSSIIDLNENN